MTPTHRSPCTRHDRRGVPVTTSHALAVDLLEDAIVGFVSHRRDTAERLERALEADPGLIPALCLRGFAYKALASQVFEREARESLSAARESLAARGGSARETALVQALACWCGGNPLGATGALERALDLYPHDLLVFKLHHAISFIVGNASAMRAAAERVVPRWDSSMPGYAFVLGCYAFALEETFDPVAAERVGRAAVELEPSDAWGAHAVAHVLESQDRAREGLRFMDQVEPALAECNNFGGHLAWHRSLFHLQLGEHGAALALHDARIAGHLGRDYRDTCNAATLLWRVQNDGFDVGNRWVKLAELSRARIGDHGSAFADAHYALSLAAAGDIPGAREFVRSMRAAATARIDHAAIVMRSVGVPLANAIVALHAGLASDAAEGLVAIEGELTRIGGSHAQRDVFALLTIEAALRSGDCDLATRLLERRLATRPSNRFALSRMRTLARTGPRIHQPTQLACS